MITASSIQLEGYLDLPDIQGESRRADHEGEIEVHRLAWQVRQHAMTVGSGRRRHRAEVGPITMSKWYDASSPYLALAAMRGAVFDEAVLTVRRDTGDQPVDYLRITMTGVTITSYDVLDDHDIDEIVVESIPERIGLSFDAIEIRYLELTGDGRKPREHEVEFDIARGT